MSVVVRQVHVGDSYFPQVVKLRLVDSTAEMQNLTASTDTTAES